MATLKQVIVDTDEAYPGWTYSTLQAAESFHQGDITAATGTDEYVVFECYATAGTIDGVVTFDGWTTEYSGQNYIEINGLLDSDYGHSGIWDDTEYRIESTGSSSVLRTYEEHFRIIGLQLYGNQTTANRHIINMNSQSDDTGELIFSHNIIRGNNGSTYDQKGIDIEGAIGQVVKIYNNIIYDISTHASADCIYMTSSGFVYIYNNVLIKGTYAVNRNAGSIIQINNICQDQVTQATNSTNADTGYNIIEDATLVANSLGGTNNDLTTGTATSYGANKLNDSGGGLSAAVVGSVVANTTDSTYAYVTVVDSDTQLTLSADAFDTGNEAYRVTSNIYGNPDFQSGNYFLTANDTLAMFAGTNLYADANSPVTDDILRNSRGSSSTDNFDIGAHHSLEYNRVVDPDSGAGFDYTSLNSWESNEQADLSDTGLYKIPVANCRSSSGSADTTALEVLGWTTDATNYINIVGERLSSAEWDASKYRLAGTDENVLVIREDYVRVDAFQTRLSYSASDTFKYCIEFSAATVAANDLRISNSIIRGNAGAGTIKYTGVKISDADVDLTIWNTIIYAFSRRGIDFSGNTLDCYNIVIEGATDQDGIKKFTGTATFINCAVFNNTDDFDTVDTIDYCASDDGDGTNAVTPSDWTTVFEDYANGNFNLKSTDTDLIGSGVEDPGSGLYSDDIVGTTRT